MRKSSIIGATLLLVAAGTACNRQLEKDVFPADRSVKLRFTAVVDATRTSYENDKTASWVAGDQISVCVTNGTDRQVVPFTADETLTFEGNVPAGYETILAGAYPADDAHIFDADGVNALNFPAAYTLAEGADPASVLPLAGTFADGVMTFRHPAGALKFTIDNVPAEAVRFRFTAAGQKVNGSFGMDPSLIDSEEEAGQTVDITFPAAAGTHTFYVPMPAGELAAGASIALYDASDNLLFLKSIPQAMTVNPNVIKRIAAVETETWTLNETWTAYYYGSYATTDNKVMKRICIENIAETDNVYYEVLTESDFNELGGSAIAYLSSSRFADRLAGMTKKFSDDFNINYNSISKGKKYVMLFSVDLDSKTFTGEYGCIEVIVPTFSTPFGWSSYAYETEGSSNPFGIRYVVPSTNTQWQYLQITKATFESSYLNDLECAIYTLIRSRKKSHEADPSSWKPRSGTQSYTVNYSGEYILISVGIDENYRPTGAYCRLDYDFAKEDPSEAYEKWLGKWSVSDGTNNDTWTIARRRTNHSYTITGMCGRTAYHVGALLNEDGSLLIKSQKSIENVVSSGQERVISLYRAAEKSYHSGNDQDLMTVTFSGSGTDSATANYCNESYQYYQFIGTNAEGSSYNYTKRPLPASLTRVVSSGVMPDEESEEEIDFEEAEPADAE